MEDEGFVERRSSVHGIIIRFELLGVLAAIVIQTLTAVWWGSAVTTKMDFIQAAIKENSVDRYTSKDAERDINRILDRTTRNEQRIVVLEKKVEKP